MPLDRSIEAEHGSPPGCSWGNSRFPSTLPLVRFADRPLRGRLSGREIRLPRYSDPALRKEMTERDPDIDFDFFEEPEPREPTRRERLVRRGVRRPSRPPRPPEGITPLLRLVGLIVLAVAVAVGAFLLIDNLRGESKQSRYEDYVEEVRQVATQSQQVGRALDNLLNTQGLEQQDLQAELGGLAQRQEQGIARARDLDPPGPLRSLQQ